MFIEFKKIKVVLCFVNSIKMFKFNLLFIVVFFEYMMFLRKLFLKI